MATSELCFNLQEAVKFRTQCFSEKNWKKFFLYILISFEKAFSREYSVVSKLLLDMPKFKENVLFCVITAIKVRDLLLTL